MRFVSALMFAALLQPTLWSQHDSATKVRAPLKVSVQGDSNLLTAFIESLEREFARQELKLVLVQPGNPKDYNLVISQESSLEGAAASVVALDNNCNFVASVVRTGRISGKGALNAAAKELAKKMAILERVK